MLLYILEMYLDAVTLHCSFFFSPYIEETTELA